MSEPRADLRSPLLDAVRSRELVEVDRSIPGADVVEGCVVAVGEQWVLLAGYNWDGVVLDRFIALRVEDVSRVERLEYADFKRKALELQGQWPPASPPQPVDLDSTRALVQSFAAQSMMINVELEHEDPEAAYIGTLLEATDEHVTLLEVTPGAEWDDEPSYYPLADITWVEFGGPYEAALAAVAGPPPTV